MSLSERRPVLAPQRQRSRLHHSMHSVQGASGSAHQSCTGPAAAPLSASTRLGSAQCTCRTRRLPSKWKTTAPSCCWARHSCSRRLRRPGGEGQGGIHTGAVGRPGARARGCGADGHRCRHTWSGRPAAIGRKDDMPVRRPKCQWGAKHPAAHRPARAAGPAARLPR